MSLRSLILLSLALSPALGMEDEQSKGIVPALLKTRELLDETHTGDKYNEPRPIKQARAIQHSSSPFFGELPDDATLKILSYLSTYDQVLKSLCSVAQTCRKGYYLTQHNSLWESLRVSLKKTYFSHVLENEFSRFIEERKHLPPLALTHNLYQHFIIDLPGSEENFAIMLKRPMFKSPYPIGCLWYFYNIGFKASFEYYLIDERRDRFRFPHKYRNYAYA